jgi:hypothetical protein
MLKSVLLDTSFFLRFLNDKDSLYTNADSYFRYFIENEIPMLISTISVAEYCIGGDVSELPLRNLQIIPFNLDHAKIAEMYSKNCFSAQRSIELKGEKNYS